MAQKTKVKELVGRGLNSYHTKALQQIDRIEKKNKEQNHKISILSNELDNDYLTKTEEGSVISLEHSKEGMVYLDELQGNTLVNYCTDGSKEMTLNGDIDVEGVSVTITEGVDNGKVDVMCEGNTLVNLKYGADGNDCNMAWADSGTIEYFNRQEYSKIHCKGEIVETANNLGISWIYHIMGQIKLHLLKTNTTYTIKLNNKYDCINGIYIQAGNATNPYLKESRKIDKDTYLITTKDSFEGLSTNGIILYGSLSKDYKGNVDYKIIGILEGDWTNREFPTEFFEGMKSVGQDDANGHKIEILSKTPNDIDDLSKYLVWSNGVTVEKINNHSCRFIADGARVWQQVGIRHNMLNQAKAGDKFTLFIESATLLNQYTENVTFAFRNATINASISSNFSINKDKPLTNGIIHFTVPSNYNGTDLLEFRMHINQNTAFANELIINNLLLAKGHLDVDKFIKYELNKKEILINEPLRSVPNGTKDRIVKIGSKYYIERNCGCVTLDENITWDGKETFDSVNRYRHTLPNNNAIHIQKNAISDKYITTNGDESYEHLRVSNGWVWYYNTQDLTYDEVKSIFTNKPTRQPLIKSVFRFLPFLS